MAVSLTLGGIAFNDFEIPESINFGGQQRLAVHKLPGGARQIDAMGPDDADIRWSGRFRGSSAEQRGFTLDYMRRQGQQVLLAWGLHRYQVVISHFEADFQYGGLEIPYSIACTVVLDETQTLASAAIGLVESLVSDLVSATGLSSVIGQPAITAAVTGVGTALSNYQAGVPNSTNLIAGASAATEGPLLSAVASSIGVAQAATNSAISTSNSSITTTGSVGGVTAGAPPASIASNLTTQASAYGTLSTLYPLASTLGRMATNVSNAGN